jgi:arylformamidase
VARGICAVIANYDLCPAVTLDGVVAAARRAIAWTYRHAADYGADPERLTLSGTSAGAHLQAMALAHDWPAEGLPPDIVKGAVPISGIYDPAPAMRTTVNAEIRLTEAVARRNDALTLAPRVRCPVALFVGEDEPREWRRQTELYASHLRRHGLEPEVALVPGAHHFSILDHYQDPASAILRAIFAMADR